MAFWNPMSWSRKKDQKSNNKLEDTVNSRNKNYEIFNSIGTDIEQAVSQKSVITQYETTRPVAANTYAITANGIEILPLQIDKTERIQQYRSMALFPECAWCIDEICNDFVHDDKDGNFIRLILPMRRLVEGDINKERHAILQEEFYRYMELFHFREDCYNLLKRFLIEGELAFENIISPKYPSKGIIGVKFLPAEYYSTLIGVQTGRSVGLLFDTERFQHDITTILSQAWMGSQQIFNTMLTSTTRNILQNDNSIALYWPQVTYICSGDFSPDGTICYPILEKCKQAYFQLALMQDSAVIRRVTRAPERLLFNVSTGNMNSHYAEQYVRRFANDLKSKKVTGQLRADGTPDIASVYNPVSMLESYVFAKSNANDGTTVETVGSTANFDEMGDIEYFLRRLMKQFDVPYSRYKTPENTSERDETISYEEHAFACSIIRLQRRFALGFKKGFITDLKLRGLWDKYQLKESDLTVEFAPPILYNIYERQKLVTAQMDTYKAVVDQEEFSKTIAMKKLLGMTDDEIDENFRSLIKEKMQIQLADWYADKINSEGPAVYDPPIKIKGEEKSENEEPSDEENNEDDSENESTSTEDNKEGTEENSAPKQNGLSLAL